MKIAIITPGNGNYLKPSIWRDAKIHRFRRSVYESINKLGYLCDYIGINDLASNRLEGYHTIILLNHLSNDKKQNQILTSFLSNNKNIVMTYNTQAARDWGISSNNKYFPGKLNFKDQNLSYKVKNMDNVITKINRKWLGNTVPLKRFFNLPVVKISSREINHVLAEWDQSGVQALVKLKKNGGHVIYFSGILAGTNDDFLKYMLSFLESNNNISYPLMPNKKKCCITIFHDFEGNYGDSQWGVYAKKGLQNILNAHKKYNIRATFNIVGKLCQTNPENVENIIKAGHEIASHTDDHVVPSKVSYKSLNLSIRKSLKRFKEKFGEDIKGFRSPESKWNADLVSILEHCKFHWNAEDEEASMPYFLVLGRKLSLMRIPIACDDYPYISEHRSADYMLDRFKKTIEEGIRTNSFVAIGFHPWVEGMREQNLDAFEALLAYISSNNDLAVMTFGETFRWWENRGFKQTA